MLEKHGIAGILTLLLLAGAAPKIQVRKIDGFADKGTVQFTGVSAGAFRAEMWQQGKLHLLPDARRPMIAPREGAFRNIYAASVIKTKDGWRIFYGGWDGVPSGNDRIYSVETTDFIDFKNRQTVIEHGVFQHVCNVSAVAMENDRWSLMCTAYPDARGLNKPSFFSSEIALPHEANRDDLISIEGYEHFFAADMNGMNALLFEDGTYRLYFSSFTERGTIYRASSRDGKQFKLDDAVLRDAMYVNDVKRFGKTYLMGFHENGGRLLYSISADPLKFPPMQELCSSVDNADKFIVSIGWVSDGGRLLGALYGAGNAKSLDKNRVFASWLQKRVVVTTSKESEAQRSLGPDRQLIDLTEEADCKVELYDDDGVTLLGASDAVTLSPGGIYEIKVANPTGSSQDK